MTNFYIGQQVINLGTTATVVGFHKITGDLILEVRWRGSDWRIVEVDGMTCQIERI